MSILYAVCPDLNSPSGGVKKLYELVDTLNDNGAESYIIHTSRDFKVTWFENSTKVTDFMSFRLAIDDIILLPEVIGEQMLSYYPGIRKIIFCQNSYYALQMFYGKPEKFKEVFLHQDIILVLVVSDYDYELFKWLCPAIKISRFICGIDERLFYFQSEKKRIITVMPRKLKSDYNFLENLLLVKGQLKTYSLQLIEDMSYQKCAEAMRGSTIFLSFSHKEGFGLPPAEAMACGCIVVGYHGQGGKEYFDPRLTYSIEPWDMMNYSKKIESVLGQLTKYPERTAKTGQAASEFILDKYSMQHQEQSILQVINYI